MANTTKKAKSRRPTKANNNLYKKGKLSKNAKFNPKRINWTPIIVLACVLATFVFAMIFGNILGEKARDSQNAQSTPSAPSDVILPDSDKVAPRNELHAYFADMTRADPEISLSEQTESARYRGNALFINLKNDRNQIIYSSDKVESLGFEHQENLTLARLSNHFQYYNDFTVGRFKSDFKANLDAETALKLQADEILLLKEACEDAFDQIIVEFGEDFTKDNLVYYQVYLLNLKLACPEAPIGINVSKDFLSNPDNAGSAAALFNIADFFVLDLGASSSEEIKSSLSPLSYFVERYSGVVIIADADESALEEKIAAVESKGVKNYVIK